MAEEKAVNPAPEANDDSKIVKSAPKVDQDGYCKIMCSMDLMEAYMVIEPPVGEGKWPTVETAMKAIEMQDIKFGLNQEAVVVAVNRRRTVETLIAKGKPAVAGKDTELKSYFELSDLKKIYIDSLVEDDKGRIDFRNVKTIETVLDGQVIGEKILPTEGDDGINVLGNSVKAQPGKERPIRIGKNTRWDEEGLRIIATGNGKPTLANNCLSVLPIHEIRGDVDFKTGNINFPGNIVVHGNVLNGFSIVADGEIVIMGDVDASDITAGGKLSIRGTVQGMDKATLTCNGDFTVKTLNRVTVNTKGSVIVKEAIMYSQVSAGRKVIVDGGKGWIVGGKVCAGEAIGAKMVGSKLGAATELEVGVTVKPSEDSPLMEAEVIEESSEQAETPVGYTYLLSLEEAPKSATLDKSRIIKIKDVLYPGVKISINTGSCLIRDEVSFVILYCSSEGKIVFQSYR